MRVVIDLQGAQNESRFRGIGRYSMALVRAMIKRAGAHDLWITLNAGFPDSLESVLNALGSLLPPEQICAFDVPVPLNQLSAENEWRVRAAEYVREQFLANMRPDIIHVSSWFEGPQDNTVTSLDLMGLGVPHAVTLYDLIPLLRPDAYLHDARVRNWYFRKAESLRRADLLLAISNSSASEAQEALRIPRENIAVVGAGIDEMFRPPGPDSRRDEAIRQRYGLHGPFILYAGAADPRKNLAGLLKAMTLIPNSLREKHKLACVGMMHQSQQVELVRLVASLGLSEQQVQFLGYVPDADLIPLYALCELFVFPSLHEGFGLPAAEAMACGAPVIGSNTTSIPAVIGRADALFDPTDASDIARCMTRVLGSESLKADLRASGVRRSELFIWDDVGRRAFEAFEALNERRQRHTVISVREQRMQSLAVVAANFLPHEEYLQFEMILTELKSDFEIVRICDVIAADQAGSITDKRIRDSKWFRQNGGDFDIVLYVIRDHARYSFALPLLEMWPGIVFLEDLSCSHLLNAALNCVTLASETAIYDSHGLSALIGTSRNLLGQPDELLRSEALFRLSDGVLVSNAEQIEVARRQYGMTAAARMRVVPAPPFSQESLADAAASWRDSILDLAGRDSRRDKNVLDLISGIEIAPRRGDLQRLASALAANGSRFGLPQILVDVSTIAETDARTGIQRVVRSILSQLLAIAPEGWRVEPVRVNGEGYVYARNFAAHAFGLPSTSLPSDAPVETRRGDVFLGLDLTAHQLGSRRPWFEAQKVRGVSVTFVVYDLLPVRRPELFPAHVPPLFRDWSTAVAQIADTVVCISRSVAEEFSAWTSEKAFPRTRPLRVEWFHLGADLEASLPTKGFPPDAECVLASLRARPSFLSVGTLEPRKRHTQTLDAFEILWAQGVDVALIIVGKQGWKTECLATRLEQHPELDRRLFWLRGISDEMLTSVYKVAAALLAASEGEGFGLPLIEAARQHLPILARDLPVFREVAGQDAAYFSGDDPESLAQAVQDWLALRATGRHPKSDNIHYQTWRESAKQLLSVVLRDSSPEKADIEHNTCKPPFRSRAATTQDQMERRGLACD